MPIPLRHTALLGAALTCAATTVSAQSILDRARRTLDRAVETAADARELQCDVQGACGEVRQSKDFAPGRYSSLVVTVTDPTRAIPVAQLGVARDAFEGQLIANGYLIAPSADVNKVRDLFAKGDGNWTDEELEELAEFVTGIDAVIVIEVRQADRSSCQLNNRSAVEATVSLSARWLNTPAGDVPWVGTHEASVCVSRQSSALADALEKAARQLATNLPMRGRNRS